MHFKSLVVMDLESSGLPAFGGKTKITELSFVGVLVEHVRDSHRTCEKVPRVLQKLSLCFYPQKQICFEASDATGLDNALLEEISPFNKEACQLLSSFLRRVPPPFCLVAHNGMKFDFPLLKAELNARSEALSEDVFCADSLLAFRAMFPINYGSRTSPSSTHLLCGNHTSTVVTLVESDCAQIDCKALTQNPSDGCLGVCSKSLQNKCLTMDIFQDHVSATDLQKANETTPKQSKSPIFPPFMRKRSLLSTDEYIESKGSLVRKKLFREQQKLKSHKLVDLYRYIQCAEQDSGHHAENDSLALLECIVSTAPQFLSWIEENHLNFKRIPCMW